MKKIVSLFFICWLTAVSLQAYTIGGMYATLISCDWGKYGYNMDI